MEEHSWSNLPDHIVIRILGYLPLDHRYRASLVCKAWNACFHSPELWRHFMFCFKTELDSRLINCVSRYGQYLCSVNFIIDQQLNLNRENACRIIRELASHKSLRKIGLRFIGENPYFYAGVEFIDALKLLFLAITKVGGGTENQHNQDADKTRENNIASNVQTATSQSTECTSRLGNTETIQDASNQSALAIRKRKLESSSKSDETEDRSHLLVKRKRTDNAETVDLQHNDLEPPRSNAVTPVSFSEFDETSNLSNTSFPYVTACPKEGQLREVDLSGFSVTLDDTLISILGMHHPLLEKLNIQNSALVVKVRPSCVLQLVQNCRKLRELHIFMFSMSKEILDCLAEDGRSPLKHLSLCCRREEKYGKELEESDWKTVVKKLPNLRVTLRFDHTCPLFRISQIMNPQIPVQILHLETFTYIYDEVRQAANYYRKTLEKMVIETPMSRNSPEFNGALIFLAESCTNLKELHVYCVLEEPTIKRILELHPQMEESKKYTLSSSMAPKWYAGRAAL